MNANKLSACLYITLALDASEADIESAHESIDLFFGRVNGDSISPKEVAATQTKTVTPAATVAGNVDVDSAGYPWDERIHASTKAKNEDGSWRNRRGVDKATLAKVQAELMSTVNATTPATAAPAAPAAPTATPTPPALTTPTLPTMPGSNAAPDPAFANFVQLIVRNTQSPTQPQARLTEDFVKQLLTHYGVANGDIQNVAHNPALIPTITEYLASEGIV